MNPVIDEDDSDRAPPVTLYWIHVPVAGHGWGAGIEACCMKLHEIADEMQPDAATLETIATLPPGQSFTHRGVHFEREDDECPVLIIRSHE